MRAVSPADREPPTAVVLGAAGFVGRNVCEALSARGWSVAAVVRRTASGLPPGCRTVRLDLLRSDASALLALLEAERPTLVVNTAGALWNVTDEQLTEGNVTLVRRLVDAVAKLPEPARLVHIGSAYEYGGQSTGRPLTEDLPERPTSRYARTKLAGTRVLTDAVADGRIDATVLRIAMSAGPYAPPDSLLGSLARRIAEQPRELRLPPLAGVREIVDVRDVADAVRRAADAPRVPPVVNIGSGTGVPLTEAVDTLIRVTGTTAAVLRSPVPDDGGHARRDAGIGEQPLDVSLARRALGWSPHHTLADALTALWDTVPGRPDASPAPLITTSNLAVDGESIHG
ncbi:NAD(P)-dependent oxidoreductase [Streptomyces sp. DSM 42041]|uniref:NAD(P)-dependent oxidoreductase n=1 Tax=Streptomyces hazeniae TaxID=3075538 RepID=A0ABU2NPW4_9ACTN|nr:NAD(P)-dependent oxidoreductase [Streptomyces sp. DSM 42041]MDT0377673.1 NAD(P)-dependent oxidoreductase [Streptomyces sp. DSM 42041]